MGEINLSSTPDRNVQVSFGTEAAIEERRCEYVERKGLGHPDTICDLMMEAISHQLCQEYLRRAGRVLHHNIDKGLLVAGAASPRLGGGVIDAPMRLIVGDRATACFQGERIAVKEIVEATARAWFAQHLRYVQPEEHLVIQNELREGSAELTDIFQRPVMTANDTSAAVGYAPLSETEQLVLAVERYLTSAPFHQRFPEAGEDVKVMAVRDGRRVRLTVAIAMVDRWLDSSQQYFQRKAEMQVDVEGFARQRLSRLEEVELVINALDDPDRRMGGMYLTVLGTSAEAADGGQVGRGNRVHGLISLHRPMSAEAAAGKNPVSHVGKIYNLFCHHTAGKLLERVEGLEAVTLWMCSQIGRPIDDPWSVAVDLQVKPDAGRSDIERTVRQHLEEELADMPKFLEEVIAGHYPIC
jgi:S-adenosylmethionine synthetase